MLQGLFGAVLSDMCHSTTGFSAMDATRSLQLATCAAELAVGPLQAEGSEQQVVEVLQKGLLQPGGNLLIKLLQVCEPCMPACLHGRRAQPTTGCVLRSTPRESCTGSSMLLLGVWQLGGGFAIRFAPAHSSIPVPTEAA